MLQSPQIMLHVFTTDETNLRDDFNAIKKRFYRYIFLFQQFFYFNINPPVFIISHDNHSKYQEI